MSTKRTAGHDVINATQDMPVLPQTAGGIYRHCHVRKVDARGLYKFICLDPLAFCQTQALFSAYYPKKRTQFHSIAEIIIVMNINTVKNYLAPFAQETRNALKEKKIPKESIERCNAFFLHALATGIASRTIASIRGVDPSQYELYYAAGLLHDIKNSFCGGTAKTIGLSKDIENVIENYRNAGAYKGKNAALVQTVALAKNCVCGAFPAPAGGAKSGVSAKTLARQLSLDADFFAPLERGIVHSVKHAAAFAKAEAL